MQLNQDKIKLLKVNYLQNKYNELSDLINNLMNHITFLDSIYYIDFNRKCDLLTELFNINKDFNSIYNNYILNNIDISLNNKYLLDIINETNENQINLLYPINNTII